MLPLHPSPEVRAEASAALGGSGVIVVPPLSVLAFHNLLSRSYLALTDSGGVQEEAAALGIPVLVCRDTTERGEGIEVGCAELVGTREADVVSAFDRIYNDKEKYRKMASAENPYGTGSPSRAIADILMKGT